MEVYLTQSDRGWDVQELSKMPASKEKVLAVSSPERKQERQRGEERRERI
jgi:hypothetical protein